MKATGLVSTIDEVGRLVLPKKIRNQLELKQVEIFLDGDSVILKKYNPSCIFCGEAGDVLDFGGKKVCRKCIKNLQETERLSRKSK